MHFSYQIPRHLLAKARPFEWPADIPNACIDEGCTMVVSSADGQMAFTPIYPLIQEQAVGDVGSCLPTKDEVQDVPVRLMSADIDGKTVKGKVRISLVDTTRYPGYAMNAGDPADDTEDWKCAGEDNETDTPFECTSPTEARLRKLESGGQDLVLHLHPYDYAAWTKLRLELLEVEIGGPAPGGISVSLDTEPSRGLVADPCWNELDWKEIETTLPIDNGREMGIEGNKIGDCGWTATTILGAQEEVNDTSAVFSDGDELGAGSGSQVGDGFIALEEYRGFRVNGAHIRTSPQY